MSIQRHRYPGVQPFRADQQHLFFGRESDIEALYELVFTEKVSVLYGKSGYGKSSLINAGILPKLINNNANRRFQFLPITVRFMAWSGNSDDTPIQKFKNRLSESLPLTPDFSFLERLNIPHNLWWECMRRMPSQGSPRLVFVFDQFEEFFTYPEPDREQFKIEFSHVLYNIIPSEVDWNDIHYDFISAQFEAKAIFSIRADRLSLLDQLTDRIPGILRKLYELRGLTKEQAREAIVQPALLLSSFISPCFEYTNAAIEQVLIGLSSDSRGHGIEAFQLQILCQYIENEVINGRIADCDGNGIPDVDTGDLPDLDNIYEDYYRRQIEQMPLEERTAARFVVEDGLLFVNEQGVDARRLSMDADVLVQRFRQSGVTKSTLQRLEDAFLLRREANSLGGYNYEISHDTLIAPVLKARTERVAEEEQARLRLDAEIARLNQREAERKRRNAVMIAIAGFVLAILATFAFILANLSEQKARNALLLAQEEREKSQLALEQFIREKKAKDALKAQDLIKNAEIQLEAGFFSAAMENLDAAFLLDSSEEVRQKISYVKIKIIKKNEK